MLLSNPDDDGEAAADADTDADDERSSEFSPKEGPLCRWCRKHIDTTGEWFAFTRVTSPEEGTYRLDAIDYFHGPPEACWSHARTHGWADRPAGGSNSGVIR